MQGWELGGGEPGDIHSNSAKQVCQSIAYPNLSSINTFDFQGNSAFLEAAKVQTSFPLPHPHQSLISKCYYLDYPYLTQNWYIRTSY